MQTKTHLTRRLATRFSSSRLSPLRSLLLLGQAPAFPRKTLVLLDALVLEHLAHHCGHVGLIVFLASIEAPAVAEREYRRFEYVLEFHVQIAFEIRVWFINLAAYYLPLPN